MSAFSVHTQNAFFPRSLKVPHVQRTKLSHMATSQGRAEADAPRNWLIYRCFRVAKTSERTELDYGACTNCFIQMRFQVARLPQTAKRATTRTGTVFFFAFLSFSFFSFLSRAKDRIRAYKPVADEQFCEHIMKLLLCTGVFPYYKFFPR